MNRLVIPNNQPAIITYPRKGSLYFPSTLISPQCPAILNLLFPPVRSVRRNKLYSSFFKLFSQFIRICCLIIHKSFHAGSGASGSLPGNRYLFQSIFYQRDFRRGRRVQVVPQRNSLAVCHHHPLRTLSAFGLSDAEPPFLAGAKLPSANVSAQLSCPRSSSSLKNDLHALSHTPRSCHSCSLRQHVDGDGYHGGRSFQRAPLRKTHKMPSKHLRSDTLRRPFLPSISGSSTKDAIFFHCFSVNSLLNRLGIIRESSFFIADSLLVIYIRDSVKI